MSGTAQIFPVVGSNFNLPSPLPTQDVSDGAPGITAPVTALQVGGKDYSGNLEALSMDTLGNVGVLGRTQMPSIVQKAHGTTASGTTVAVAFVSNVQVGNTIVVVSALGSSSAQAVTISDTLKNQYQTATLAAANNIGTQIMFAPVLVSGANTVTMTVNSSLALGMEIYEVRGIGILDAVISNSSAGAASISQAITINVENEIAFMAVGAGAQTISATSPASPANISADSGNLATGGSNLVNFAAFSAAMGSPIASASANSGNITNTFKITFAGSVANTFSIAVFRPTVLQIVGITTPTITAVTLGDASPNAAVSVPNGTALTGGLGTYISEVYPFLYNGSTWDRQRTSAFQRCVAAGSQSVAIWTPAATHAYRLMKYKIEGTANLAVTTAGIIPIYFNDGTPTSGAVGNGGTYLQHLLFIPSTAGTTLAAWWDSDWIDLGNGFISQTLGNPLTLCINGPLASTTVNAGFTQTSGSWESIQELFKTHQQTGGPSAQLIQTAAATPLNSTSIAKAYGNGPGATGNSAGNTLIVAAMCANNATLTISDTLSNSWTSSTQQTTSTTHTIRVFYVVGCKGGANTITVTQNGSAAQMKMLLFEYAGITAADSTSGTTGSSTTPAPGNATAAATSDFVFSCAANSGNANAISAAGAFRLINSSSDANGTLAAEDDLNQLPSGFAGAFNVIVAGTDGAGLTAA